MPGAPTFCQATIGHMTIGQIIDEWLSSKLIKNYFYVFLPQSNSHGALTICQVTIGQMTIGQVPDE